MTIPKLPILLVAALALGASSAWKITADAKDDHYTAIMERQRANAEEALRKAQEKAVALERKHIKLATRLDRLNDEHTKEKDQILADNRRLARQLGGLRDPGRQPACDTSVSSDTTAPGDTADTAASGRLSDEATSFLLAFARECDRAADYANTAHDWAAALNVDSEVQPRRNQ